MKIGKLALAASALGLAVSPIAAQTADLGRAAAPVESESELGGDNSSIIVIFALLAATVFLFAADSDPVSP